MTSSNADREHPGQRLKRISAGFAGNLLVHPLSKLARRRKKLWLFGYQKGGFTGNSKALFLWTCEHRRDIDAAWISPDPAVVQMLRAHGYAAHRRGSLAANKLSLSAGAYFFCHGPEDISFPLSGGALVVNLWHGVGLKALAFGDPTSLLFRYGQSTGSRIKRKLHADSLTRPDVFVTTSPFTQDHFSTQLRLSPNRCPPLGYPRADVQSDPKVVRRLCNLPGSEPRALWPAGVSEVYAYVPTYRDSGRPFLSEALPDLSRLDAVLERRNAVMFIKLHRHSSHEAKLELDRVRIWPEHVDLDSSLPHLTGLITDYSSVHYDYIYHSDCGSILYPFDQGTYLANDRSLLYPFDQNTAGWRAHSFEELLRLLEAGYALRPHPDVPRVRRKFWGDADGAACERIVGHVEQRLASDPKPKPFAHEPSG